MKVNENELSQLRAKLNEKELFRKVSRDFDDVILFTSEDPESGASKQSFTLRIRNGECVEANSVTGVVDSGIIFSAQNAVWQDLLDGQSNIIEKVMENKIKLKGSVDLFMRNLFLIKIVSNSLQELRSAV